MTKEEAIKLAEEVFDEEYSGLDKDSFLIGFQEAFNAMIALYKDKFELVRRVQEAVIDLFKTLFNEHQTKEEILKLESKANEFLKNLN